MIPTDQCKINSSCNLVVPIDEQSSIGNSITAINLNFENLEIYNCNLTTSATEIWNPTVDEFNELKIIWSDAANVVQTYSSCWNDAFSTVSTLSSFWLKPISLVYPYPFESSDTNLSDTVESWLNENFPAVVGSCYNFIVGQELFVFTPQYAEINRSINSSQAISVTPGIDIVQPLYKSSRSTIWVRPPTEAESKNPAIGPFITQTGSTTNVTLRGFFRCISRTSGFNIKVNFTVDSTVETIVPDKFIEKVVGLKYKIDPDTYRWTFVENLYNLT